MGVSCGRGKMEFPEEPFMGGLPDKTEANCEGYDAKRYHLLDGILSKRGDDSAVSVPLVSLQAVPRFQFCFSICKGNLFFQFLAHRIAF